MDVKDPFRDLSFDGRPAGYRKFRSKVILSVASLEDKQQHVASPRLLNRLDWVEKLGGQPNICPLQAFAALKVGWRCWKL